MTNTFGYHNPVFGQQAAKYWGDQIKKGINKIKDKFSRKNDAKGGTYVLKDKDGVVQRTGRTNDHDRRRGEHGRDKATGELDYEVDRRTDDYNAQRGREQIIYDKNPQAMQRNGGLNKNRPIDPNNSNWDTYMDAGKKL